MAGPKDGNGASAPSKDKDAKSEPDIIKPSISGPIETHSGMMMVGGAVPGVQMDFPDDGEKKQHEEEKAKEMDDVDRGELFAGSHQGLCTNI